MARRSFALASALLVVLVLAVGVAGSAAGGSVDGDPPVLHSASEESPEELETWIRIELTRTGDAEWSVEYRFNISEPAQEAAFEDLVEDVQTGQVDPGIDQSLFEGYRDEAAVMVDREMRILDAGWTARTEDDVGILAFEFTWTNFANTTNDRIVVGDVFLSEDGTWFEGIEPGTRLTIDAPPGYAVESSPPDRGVDNGQISWTGPATFEPGYIEIRYIVGELAPTDGGIDWWLAGLLGIALVVGAIMVAVGYRRYGTVTDAGAVTGPVPDAPVDEDLLSDEERVEHLLAEYGGRMKQATIVEETGWSNAKVSQLLTRMDEHGRVEKLRLGRENLISLPSDDDE